MSLLACALSPVSSLQPEVREGGREGGRERGREGGRNEVKIEEKKKRDVTYFSKQ